MAEAEARRNCKDSDRSNISLLFQVSFATQREEKEIRTQSTREERAKVKAKDIKDGEDQDREEERAKGKDSKEGVGYATKSGAAKTNAQKDQARMDQDKEEQRIREEKESKDNVGTAARRGMHRRTAPTGERARQ